MALVTRPRIVPKLWGAEHWIANTERYCGKVLHLHRGWQCSLHRHLVKDETFFVLSGRVWMELGVERFELERFEVGAGLCVHVLAGTLHRFAGLTDAQILEVSTHHDDADVERVEPSRAMA